MTFRELFTKIISEEHLVCDSVESLMLETRFCIQKYLKKDFIFVAESGWSDVSVANYSLKSQSLSIRTHDIDGSRSNKTYVLLDSAEGNEILIFCIKSKRSIGPNHSAHYTLKSISLVDSGNDISDKDIQKHLADLYANGFYINEVRQTYGYWKQTCIKHNALLNQFKDACEQMQTLTYDEERVIHKIALNMLMGRFPKGDFEDEFYR